MPKPSLDPELLSTFLAVLSRWSVAHNFSTDRLKPIPVLDLTIRRTFHWALPVGGLSGSALLFYELAKSQGPK